MLICVGLDGMISPRNGTRPGVLATEPSCVIESVQVVPMITFLACALRTSAAETVRVHFPTSSFGGGDADAVATTISAATSAARSVFMAPTLCHGAPAKVIPAG